MSAGYDPARMPYTAALRICLYREVVRVVKTPQILFCLPHARQVRWDEAVEQQMPTTLPAMGVHAPDASRCIRKLTWQMLREELPGLHIDDGDITRDLPEVPGLNNALYWALREEWPHTWQWAEATLFDSPRIDPFSKSGFVPLETGLYAFLAWELQWWQARAATRTHSGG